MAPGGPASVAAPAAVAIDRPATVAPAVAGPFDPAREFDRVAATQSPDFKVEAAADKPQLKIDKDIMAFQVSSDKEGFLYVFQYGSDGGIVQVFPNLLAKNNRMRADTVLVAAAKKAPARSPADRREPTTSWPSFRSTRETSRPSA